MDKAAFQGNKNLIFSVDVIVPKGKENELYSYAQKELTALDFEIKAKIEKRKMEVGVLTCFDKEKLMAYQSNKSAQTNGVGMVNASQYKRNGVSLDELLKGFLESFGHGKMPLVNETGIEGVFDFDISLDLEDKATLKNALEKYGLRLTKDQREVEMLVILPGH